MCSQEYKRETLVCTLLHEDHDGDDDDDDDDNVCSFTFDDIGVVGVYITIYVLSTLNERECVFQVSAVNYGLMAQTLLLFTVDQGNVVKVGESNVIVGKQ